VGLVEELRHHETHHGVAQELEALVAAALARLVREGGVREGRFEELAPGEAVRERPLERLEVRRRALPAQRSAPAIQPPPSTTSPASKTAAWPGATAASGSSKRSSALPAGPA
jgi:hypothetical protein